MSRKRPSLSLVGAGRVGSTLATALHKQGYAVLSVVNRSGPAAVALARRVSCRRASTQVADIDRSADILIFAVGDPELPGAVSALARLRGLKLKKTVVLHTSGVHSAAVLAPLRRAGASVASFHPLQTFPLGSGRGKKLPLLRGIPFAVDGDEAALKTAGSLAALLGAHLLPVDPGMRPLYHAACVFASSYLAVVLNAIAGLSASARLGGAWTATFGPLMTASMQNLVNEGPGDALTGPAARGDAATIALHLRAIEEAAPEFAPLYTVCALEVARLALRGGKIGQEDFGAVMKAVRSALRYAGGRPAKKR